MTALLHARSTRAVATVTRAIAVLGAVALTTPPRARAQLPGDVAPVRPVRIEGYWNRDRRAPGVLDGITIVSDDGGTRRTFGVTALQAYKPEEEGVQVLRHSSQQPGLRLLGRREMVRRFMNAPETEKVVAFGVYRPATGTLTLSSVEVGGQRESS